MIPIILWLIFVQPNGETYTTAEQAYTITQVKQAAAFWGYEADIRTSFLSTDKAVFDTPIDQWAIIPTGNAGITIYVVDTSKTDQLFFDSYGGYAQRYYQIITAVRNINLGSSLAHEMGHVIYGLPDWYLQPGKCTAIDIMCDAVTAYARKIKGCLTLDFLGTPCYTVAMPLVITQRKVQSNGHTFTDVSGVKGSAYDQSSSQRQKATPIGKGRSGDYSTSSGDRTHEFCRISCYHGAC